MSSRGSSIDRVLAFYREQSPDVVRVTHQLAGEIIAERGIGSRASGGAKPKRQYLKKSKLSKGVAESGTQVSGGSNE